MLGIYTILNHNYPQHVYLLIGSTSVQHGTKLQEQQDTTTRQHNSPVFALL